MAVTIHDFDMQICILKGETKCVSGLDSSVFAIRLAHRGYKQAPLSGKFELHSTAYVKLSLEYCGYFEPGRVWEG